MFDAADSNARRGCSICRLHYMARATPDGLIFKPACTCEADAAARANTQALVDRARGPLDDAQRAVAETLRHPTDEVQSTPP